MYDLSILLAVRSSVALTCHGTIRHVKLSLFWMSRTRPLAFQIFPNKANGNAFLYIIRNGYSQSKKSTLIHSDGNGTFYLILASWIEQVLDNHSEKRLFDHSKYVSHHQVPYAGRCNTSCITASIKAVTFMKSYHQCSPALIDLSVRLSNHLSIFITTGPHQSSPNIRMTYFS